MHDSFKETIVVAWQSFSPIGCHTHHFVTKLKSLKDIFRKWKVEVFGNIHSNVKKARDTLALIQDDITENGISLEKYKKDIQTRNHLKSCNKMENEF